MSSDDKNPDGITSIPMERGRLLIWDAIFPDTFAPLHLEVAARGAGGMAEQAERARCLKYSALESKYLLLPVAIESLGMF